MRALIACLLVAAAVVPWVADRARNRQERCEADGSDVTSAFRVRVVETDGTPHAFCGVRCADLWIKGRASRVPTILVTDFTTGREVPADAAWFVESLSTWGDGVPDAIRAFRRKGDAIRHVEAYGGRFLRGSNRPFGSGSIEHARHGR